MKDMKDKISLGFLLFLLICLIILFYLYSSYLVKSSREGFQTSPLSAALGGNISKEDTNAMLNSILASQPSDDKANASFKDLLYYLQQNPSELVPFLNFMKKNFFTDDSVVKHFDMKEIVAKDTRIFGYNKNK
jgi:hypothetical protein